MKTKKLISQIVSDNQLHAKWLNTLSLLENEGSRKIAACENKIDVRISVLKHAAEEARHAYYLKTQIKKLSPLENFESYSREQIFAAIGSYQYLNKLDTSICRFLYKRGMVDENLRYGAYLLTTYAIEVRADLLYPIYAEVLNEIGSNITVKMIIAEEIGHLEEMQKQIKDYFDEPDICANYAVEIENQIHKEWILNVEAEVSNLFELA